MLEDLRAAALAGDWPAALALALAAWRAHRLPALADLVDGLGARCSRPLPRRRGGLHAWWTATAGGYDPLDVDRLVATADEQLGATVDMADLATRHATSAVVRGLAAVSPTGFWRLHELGAWIDRLAYILDGHDDPRWAPVLARWLAPPQVLAMPFAGLILYWPTIPAVVFGAIAKRLGELGDARVLPLLDGHLHAEPAVAAIRARTTSPSPALVAEVAALQALVAPPVAPRDAAAEARLWAEVIRHPDDDAPRLVLADHLAQHGDPRGELFALQLAGTPAATTLANRLIAIHGKRWLGPVAAICTRRGTVWRRGMLERIRIGAPTLAPAAAAAVAFAAARGHRELACVRHLVPATVGLDQFANVADALPNLVGLTLAGHEALVALQRLRATWPLRRVELGGADHIFYAAAGPVPALELLAEVVPDLEELVVASPGAAMPPRTRLLAELALAIPWFPHLRQVWIPEVELAEPSLAALRALPIVVGYAGPLP